MEALKTVNMTVDSSYQKHSTMGFCYPVVLSLFTPTGEKCSRPSWWAQWAEGTADGASQSGCFPVSEGLCFQGRQDTAWRFRPLFWDVLHNSSKKQQVILLFLSSLCPSGPGWPWNWIDRKEEPQTRNLEREGAGRNQEAQRKQNWPRSRCHFKNLNTHESKFPTRWPSVWGSGNDTELRGKET